MHWINTTGAQKSPATCSGTVTLHQGAFTLAEEVFSKLSFNKCEIV